MAVMGIEQSWPLAQMAWNPRYFVRFNTKLTRVAVDMPEQESSDDDRSKATSEAADGIGGVRWRTVAFAFASLALAVAGVALALQYFVAERLPELTEAKLESAMQRWQQNGPANYKMEIELRGAQPGQVHVEVEDKSVTMETRNGRTPGRWTWDTWSVPGMFDTLTQDLQIAADPEQQIDAAKGTKWRLRCEFDAKYGYPLQYHRLVTGGPEVFWRVTKFEAK